MRSPESLHDFLDIRREYAIFDVGEKMMIHTVQFFVSNDCDQRSPTGRPTV